MTTRQLTATTMALLLTGCGNAFDTPGQQAERAEVNSRNALTKANAAESRVNDLQAQVEDEDASTRVDDLEQRVEEIEAKLAD